MNVAGQQKLWIAVSKEGEALGAAVKVEGGRSPILQRKGCQPEMTYSPGR